MLLPVEPIIGVTRVRVRIVAAEVVAGLSVLPKNVNKNQIYWLTVIKLVFKNKAELT
jgi:hypothetical protein